MHSVRGLRPPPLFLSSQNQIDCARPAPTDLLVQAPPSLPSSPLPPPDPPLAPPRSPKSVPSTEPPRPGKPGTKGPHEQDGDGVTPWLRDFCARRPSSPKEKTETCKSPFTSPAFGVAFFLTQLTRVHEEACVALCRCVCGEQGRINCGKGPWEVEPAWADQRALPLDLFGRSGVSFWLASHLSPYFPFLTLSHSTCVPHRPPPPRVAVQQGVTEQQAQQGFFFLGRPATPTPSTTRRVQQEQDRSTVSCASL